MFESKLGPSLLREPKKHGESMVSKHVDIQSMYSRYQVHIYVRERGGTNFERCPNRPRRVRVVRSVEPKQDTKQVLPPPPHDEPSTTFAPIRESLEVSGIQ